MLTNQNKQQVEDWFKILKDQICKSFEEIEYPVMLIWRMYVIRIKAKTHEYRLNSQLIFK